MTYFIGLCMAVISSLLCQWILKHTYSDFDWVYIEDSDSEEGILRRKDWNKKLTVKRWYILSIWFICGLLSVASLVVPLILALIVAMNQCYGEWHFKVDSKIARWLNEEL